MNLRLQSKVQRTESQISHIDEILAAKELPKIRKQDLYAKKEILMENVLSKKIYSLMQAKSTNIGLNNG